MKVDSTLRWRRATTRKLRPTLVACGCLALMFAALAGGVSVDAAYGQKARLPFYA